MRNSICKFLASQLCGNYPKLLRTSVIHWDMARAISLMLHCDLGVESHNFFQTFAANANMFLMNFNRENFFEVPQVGDGISGPASEAPDHCCPWHPPRLLSTARTPQPRLCRCPPPRGAAFGLRQFSRGYWPLWLRRTTAEEAEAGKWRKLGSWALYCTRSTDKRTILDILFKLFKARTSFNASSLQIILPSIAQHVNELTTCFQTLKRPVKAMSSIRW